MTRIRFDGCDLSPVTGHPGRRSATRPTVGRRRSTLDGETTSRSVGRAARGRGARATSRLEPAREPPLAPLPDELRPARRATRSPRAASTLYAHQADAWEAARARRARDRHDRHREREDARLQPAGARRARRASRSTRALYLYPTKALAQDQARALAELRRPAASAPAIYDGDTRARAALADPQVGERDPHQPGHAPRRRPAAPRPLGRRAHEPPLRRRRRGARLPRRLRLARRQRAAAAAPAGARLRRRAAVPARLGDDREPRRARRARCSGVDVDGRRRRRGAARRADDRALEPAAARRGARPARERARRGVAAAWPALVARGLRTICFAKSRKAAELDPPLHGRAASTPSSRALSPYRAGYTPAQRREIERRLVEGELLGVVGDGRARARDRHRPARLRDLGRLPRARSRRCASSGAAPGGAATGSPSSSRARTRSTSTSCASPRRCSGGASRRRSSTTRTRASSTATSARPRSRRRSTTPTARRSATRRSSAPPLLPELERDAGGLRLGGPRLPGRARRRSARRARLVHGRRRARRARCSASSSASARTRRCTRARSTSTSASRTSCASSTSTRARRVVEPFARRLLHAGEEGDDDGDRASRCAAERRLGLELSFGDVVGDRAGGRLPEEGDPRRLDARDSCRSTCPRRRSRPRRSGTCPSRSSSRGSTQMPTLLGALHAAEHAMIALLPLWAMCDRWDIGGLSTNVHFQTGRPTVFVYDGHAGGVGIAERGFDVFEGWVADTARMLDGCPCERRLPVAASSRRSAATSTRCSTRARALDAARSGSSRRRDPCGRSSTASSSSPTRHLPLTPARHVARAAGRRTSSRWDAGRRSDHATRRLDRHRARRRRSCRTSTSLPERRREGDRRRADATRPSSSRAAARRRRGSRSSVGRRRRTTPRGGSTRGSATPTRAVTAEARARDDRCCAATPFEVDDTLALPRATTVAVDCRPRRSS